MSAGAALTQLAGSGAARQQWDVIDVGDGNFKIMNRQSGLVLDTGGSMLDGAAVVQAVSVDSWQQHWSLLPMK